MKKKTVSSNLRGGSNETDDVGADVDSVHDERIGSSGC